MRWYRTEFNKIYAVEIERFNDVSVWIEGRRQARVSGWRNYYPTWDDAHKALLVEATNDVDRCRRHLERAKDIFGNIKGMKKP